MSPRTSPKKDAVLAIGLDRPTAEIVAAAKAHGVEVSGTYVDLLKKGASSGRPKKASGKPAASAKKTSAPKARVSASTQAKPAASNPAPEGKATTKAAYVRSLGPSVMPGEIMERAKKDGVKLTLAYVYNLRKGAKKSAIKAKADATPSKRRPGRPAKAAGGSPKRTAGRRPKASVGVPAGADERALRAAVAAYVVEHGVAAMRAIVEDVGAKLRAAASA